MASLQVPSLMRTYLGNQPLVQLRGATLSEALTDLCERYPAIRPHIIDQKGNLRRYVNFFINQVNIKDLQGLETTLQENDLVILLPSISGG